MFSPTAKRLKVRAFTLIELLVTISIFVFMTALILARYNGFNSETLLSNTAYDVALTARQAQSYGTSVLSQGGTVASFNAGYGLHFSASDGSVKFVLFADQFLTASSQGNHTCDNQSGNISTTISECDAGTEFIKDYVVKNGLTIAKFCGVLPQDVWPANAQAADTRFEDCSTNSSSGSNIQYMDVTFTRPDPDAVIKTDLATLTHVYKSARVYIQNPQGLQYVVEISSNGQISAKPVPVFGAAPINIQFFAVTPDSPDINNNPSFGSTVRLGWQVLNADNCSSPTVTSGSATINNANIHQGKTNQTITGTATGITGSGRVTFTLTCTIGDPNNPSSQNAATANITWATYTLPPSQPDCAFNTGSPYLSPIKSSWSSGDSMSIGWSFTNTSVGVNRIDVSLEKSDGTGLGIIASSYPSGSISNPVLWNINVGPGTYQINVGVQCHNGLYIPYGAAGSFTVN